MNDQTSTEWWHAQKGKECKGEISQKYQGEAKSSDDVVQIVPFSVL